MEPTPRHRVLSDRIPRVLVFFYYCRGLSGNREERPTCQVYIEILTCRAIFYHLEDFRSHGNEWEAERARGQGTHPPPLGARPVAETNQVPSHGLCSTDLKDQGEPFNQCRFDPTAQIHLRGIYKQTPWPLEETPFDPYSLFVGRAKARVWR